MIDPTNATGAAGSARLPFADAERLLRALEACEIALWEWRIPDDLCLLNAFSCELLGLPSRTSSFPPSDVLDLVHEDDVAMLNEAIRESLRTDTYLVHEFRIRRDDSADIRWLAIRARVVERGSEGEALVMAGVGLDITQRRREEEAKELLNREIGHRMKNLLSIVGSLVTMSGEHRPEAREFVASFQARLNSLASTHELLTLADWRPIALGQLFERVLAPLGIFDRIEVVGDRDVLLGSPDAQTVALVLHELATNAIKYGALCNGAGRVRLSVEVEDSRQREEPFLVVLRWEEIGGPAVAPPSTKGFGLTLLERLTRRDERGEPVLEWRAAGLYCCIALRVIPVRLGLNRADRLSASPPK